MLKCVQYPLLIPSLLVLPEPSSALPFKFSRQPADLSLPYLRLPTTLPSSSTLPRATGSNSTPSSCTVSQSLHLGERRTPKLTLSLHRCEPELAFKRRGIKGSFLDLQALDSNLFPITYLLPDGTIFVAANVG